MPNVSIVGAACRLPGARNDPSFRDLLNRQISAVGQLPAGRWHRERHFHPDPRAAGSSYTFAGGYIDSPYDFDVGVFGMSPREAAQVDPQQRLLAEVVWEALEDARIAPEALAGSETGVYIGASSLDHANLFGGDPGAIESHFMSGNTLSVVANRISYLFDLKGPSFAIDTACSSSLVAVDRAVADLRCGRVDTAIVGGVNMLLSPASFIGFSRAAMLSPTGACRPFSDRADGYVRAEGAVVFVLRRAADARPGSVRASIVGTAVNSDGRTSGIALPGLAGQTSLLERAYADAGIAPSRLAFVEAHGTGTAVGDPIEAAAIGEVLGRRRDAPLPIGSVKGNIGHLEPASGVAGMMKALIALEQRLLPATLHLDRRNPAIDFERFNLDPVAAPLQLGEGQLHCGVSSFGFGGTNAHVIMAGPEPVPETGRIADAPAIPPAALVVSAQCKAALAAQARACADLLDAGVEPRALATAMAGGRALLRHRAVLPIGDGREMARALRDHAQHSQEPGVVVGNAVAERPPLCFVYNGNGAQWAGMGRAALAANPAFADAFAKADSAFRACGIAPLAELIAAPDLEQRLACAAVAQPLIFAIQAGLVAALDEQGMRPDFVIGHSVGEIAAAHAAGALDLSQCARILAARAHAQEEVRGDGGMLALAINRAEALRLIAQAGLSGVAVAADNGPNSTTLSGPDDELETLLAISRRQRIAGRRLDIDYPYHSPLLDTAHATFVAEAGIIAGRPPLIPMISTVTGEPVGNRRLDTTYWWRNIREEVRFGAAIRAAAKAGARLFVEIGPRAILSGAIGAIVADAGFTGAAIASLNRSDKPDRDPVAATVARAIAYGFTPPWTGACRRASVDRAVSLPGYPWQRQTLRLEPTPGAIDIHGSQPGHPLIGARLSEGGAEWRTVLDARRVPYLADHVVGGEIVVPGTALAEMALAAARAISPDGPLCIEDFDIVQALVLPRDGQREIAVRIGEQGESIEILSRPRATGGEWRRCARGRIVGAPTDRTPPRPITDAVADHADSDALYERARVNGIEYGTAFRLVRNLRRDDGAIELSLAAPPADAAAFGVPQVLHPASLDAAFHGLFDLEDDSGLTWLPIRFERLTVWRDGADVRHATVVINSSNDHIKSVTTWLRDAEGTVVARLDSALLRATALVQVRQPQRLHHLAARPAGLSPEVVDMRRAAIHYWQQAGVPPESEAWLLLHAHMRAAAHAALDAVADAEGQFHPAMLTAMADSAGRAVITAALDELAAARLIEPVANGRWRLDRHADFPEAEAILATFAAENPDAVLDLALSAQAAAALPGLFGEGAAPAPRAALAGGVESGSLRYRRAIAGLTGAVQALLAAAGRPLHVIVTGRATGLVTALAPLARAGALRLTVAAPDDTGAERLRRDLPRGQGIEIVSAGAVAAATADLTLAIGEGIAAAQLAMVAGMLQPGGVMLAAELCPDPLAIFQLGLFDAGTDAAPGMDLAAVPTLGQCESFGEREEGLVIHLASPMATATDLVLFGRVQCHVLPENLAESTLGLLAPALESEGMRCDALDRASSGSGGLFIVTPQPGAERLAGLLDALRAEIAATPPARDGGALWVVVLAGDHAAQPTLAALRAFVRVAMNERADTAIRFVEIAAAQLDPVLARRLAALVAGPGEEREWTLDRLGALVPRISPGCLVADDAPRAEAVALAFPRPGSLDQFEWNPIPLRPLAPGEIAVKVTAAGLNFRDVMLALGLLSDDVLDEGRAGAVHGLECAGRVVAVGSDVTAHRPGDLVVGFSQRSFASHVIAESGSFLPVPAGLSCETAAGVPVAFTTAWYALVELARLAPGERVLIHGGAGAVGLAAIQIAADRGAEVIATVSAPDKEAVARLYGAHHVYDSRSLAFAEQVRERHGGVDVVLNSLAGEAMRASLRCLRPRGRFLELGKRDYVLNSQLGLRPFRRNLSYFGVDLDQLLALDPALVMTCFDTAMAGLTDGRYLPLPTAVHSAGSVGEAFRLMQAAGHVGKLVIAPPAADATTATATGRFEPGEAVQLVVGGTRGFGLETALWLAEKGARRIVVASRSGRIDDSRRPAVEALRQAGVVFAEESVDVSSAASVAALVARVVGAHGPISGIYQAAVTLADGTLDNLDAASLGAVLAPKAAGAEHLHAATLDQPIERFVLFSSVSALFGNPGQAAYAAANGYLEGLARRRHRAGLPALAVAWGAIADVGLLAERAGTMESLGRIAGIVGMSARDALDELERLLAMADSLADPVVTCAEFTPGAALALLPVATSPAFAAVLGQSGPAMADAGLGLAERIAGLDHAEAQALVRALVTEEVARILRLPAEEIDLDSEIDGLGIDSLMAVELRLNMEARHRIELPVMAIGAARTLRELAQRVLAAAEGEDGGNDEIANPVESALLARHGGAATTPSAATITGPTERINAGMRP